MEDIIKIKNSSYKRYEELLLRRDALKKEAFIWQRNYVAEFGDLILDVFRKKLECIRKKKTIEYCQMAANHGGSIDQEKLREYLAEQMASFNAQLEDMIEDTASAKAREQISEADALKIRKIYHKLVKLIHPDINPMTEENPILSELWQKIQTAYRCNCLSDLEETELLVEAVLEKLGIGEMDIEIPDIDGKIEEAEAEIVKIRETDPYLYKFLLEDPDAIKEKRESLMEELKSYEDYSAQLDEILNGLIANGVSFVWRMN